MAHYTLYGMWPSGPTYRVALMLALSGEAFDYVHVDLLQGEHRSPEYLARNRYGVVPCLIDTASGQAFSQSSAIVEMLAEQTGKLYGRSTVERTVAREWIFWAADRLSSGVYRTRAAKLGFYKATEEIAAHYVAEAEAALKALDGWLGHNAWIAGDEPTFGDVDLYAIVHYVGQAGLSLETYPHVAAWVGRIEALPGYASPTALLPKESKSAAAR